MSEAITAVTLPGPRHARGLDVVLETPATRPLPGDTALPPRRRATREPTRVPVDAGAVRREEMAARLEAMMNAAVAASIDSFTAFVERYDFTRHRVFADIGGATGELSCLVAARHPRLACRSVDVPAAQPIAEARIRARGLDSRVRALAIDFVADDFPAADLIAMGMILHDWNIARKRMLIAKAYRALPPGGAMVALECAVEGERRRGGGGAISSHGRTIEFGDCCDLSGPDFAGWCAEAGFVRRDILPLTATANAIIAHK